MSSGWGFTGEYGEMSGARIATAAHKDMMMMP
jgi:hypothetical protein